MDQGPSRTPAQVEEADQGRAVSYRRGQPVVGWTRAYPENELPAVQLGGSGLGLTCARVCRWPDGTLAYPCPGS